MFTNADYAEYFGEAENLLKESMVIYTDLLNEINNNAIKSKLEPLAAECMESFRYIRQQKEKFM